MSVFDKMIRESFRSNKKETPEERKKRLIEEGKATDADFPADPDPEQGETDYETMTPEEEAELNKKRRKAQTFRPVSPKTGAKK